MSWNHFAKCTSTIIANQVKNSFSRFKFNFRLAIRHCIMIHDECVVKNPRKIFIFPRLIYYNYKFFPQAEFLLFGFAAFFTADSHSAHF